MFDKILFNRNAFDRSVSSRGINLIALGKGTFTIPQLVMRTPFTPSKMEGSGAMRTQLVMRQNVGFKASGTGSLEPTELVLLLSMSSKLSGSSLLTPGLINRFPIGLNMVGQGKLDATDRVIMVQYMSQKIEGFGLLENKLVFQFPIESMMTGSSKSNFGLIVQIHMPMDLHGVGNMDLNRLGDTNENILELEGLNLLPGQTVTIDTDLLQVLIGSHEDVSSVTPESVFFELYPGENEVQIATDADETIEVITIWQNRWL